MTIAELNSINKKFIFNLNNTFYMKDIFLTYKNDLILNMRKVKIKVLARDSARNTDSTFIMNLNINKDSDIPVLKVDSLLDLLTDFKPTERGVFAHQHILAELSILQKLIRNR